MQWVDLQRRENTLRGVKDERENVEETRRHINKEHLRQFQAVFSTISLFRSFVYSLLCQCSRPVIGNSSFELTALLLTNAH